jgi:hypothetical protein
MRADESNVHDVDGVIDSHHQSVFIARDVEHHTIVPHDTGISIGCLDVGRIFPVSLEHFAKPRFQRLFGIVVELLFEEG